MTYFFLAHSNSKCNLFCLIVSLSSPQPTNAAQKHVNRHVHKKITTWRRPVSACYLPCQITGTVVYLFSPPMIVAILKTIHSAASFCSDAAVAGKVTDFFLMPITNANVICLKTLSPFQAHCQLMRHKNMSMDTYTGKPQIIISLIPDKESE